MLTFAGTACNGTIVNDTEMGEVIQLQGDQRKDVQEFLVDKKEGLELDAKTIKVTYCKAKSLSLGLTSSIGPWVLERYQPSPAGFFLQWTDRSLVENHECFTSCFLRCYGAGRVKAWSGRWLDTL